MKVRATFQHVFEVTREVEVDDEDFARLVRHEEARERPGSDAGRLLLWINSQDEEVIAEAFPDWKTNAPLPSDFELLYSEATEVESAPQSSDP